MVPAYLYQSPSGIPGDITRVDETNVEPERLVAVSSVYAQAFGIPLAYNGAGVSQWQASNTAAHFAGILVREVPSIAGSTAQGFNDAIPNPDSIQGMAVRGYISVKCTIGTPVRGGIVYIRVTAASGKAIGDLEATADGSDNVALSTQQATWAVNGKDGDNNTELRIQR